MSNYTAPVEDMGFVLREVVELEKLCSETCSWAGCARQYSRLLHRASNRVRREEGRQLLIQKFHFQ